VDFRVSKLVEDVGIYKFGPGNNQRIWCTKASQNLETIEITTVRQLLEKMFVLNTKLEAAGLIRFKRETIDLFTRLGVNLFVKSLKGDVQCIQSSNHEVMVTESIQEKENGESQRRGIK
jgi:hypothetical protein